MNVLMLSPGFPVEQPFFTRGLAEVGAKVIGMGDQPKAALPEMCRESLSAYVQVKSLTNIPSLLDEVRQVASRTSIDLVETLWEPVMIPAARIREMLGVPGMTADETTPFRDKEVMKQRLDAAGIRTPRHGNATTSGQIWEHAERIGFPLIVKPIDGAGSQDTYKVQDKKDLERVIGLVRHVPEVSVEEFVEGEDYTFDTVAIRGEPAYYNIAYYRPRALVARAHEWISQQTICRRDVDSHHVEQGREMGFAVMKALGVQTGFTHMEWYRKPDGEAVFGEIAARAPGVRTVDLMNFACDIDLYRGWAEAVCHGRFTQPIDRKYFSAGIFKRANGRGTVRKIDGLDRVLEEFGHHICAVNLTPVGQPRRDSRSSVIGDGFVMLRHPDLEATLEMADRVSTEVQLYAS
ncbi:MAG: carbamoyl phosphate synthase large subunit [Gemmatimonadota bacterium]|nr:MAG: carbamoyl phosphate synthase large subunit [Gemmatimonadota bacterium]